jgi:hypothetical protein
VNTPRAAHIARARRLLAHEGASSNVDAEVTADAAGRLYEQLQGHFAPLLGGGVQALLDRSVRVLRDESLRAAGSPLDSVKLRACLRSRDPAEATESAATLFATFFELLTTFIGERLTTEVLRSAWPTIDDTASGEKSQ